MYVNGKGEPVYECYSCDTISKSLEGWIFLKPEQFRDGQWVKVHKDDDEYPVFCCLQCAKDALDKLFSRGAATQRKDDDNGKAALRRE